MSSEPILFTPAAYTLAMGVAMLVGTFVMRQTKKRFPNITSFQLVATCFVAMCLFDVLLEGIIWLPMGVFEYPGGHWSLFPDTYHKYPLNEMFTIGSVFTALATLRYFTNDKGQMAIERGVDQVKGSKTRKVSSGAWPRLRSARSPCSSATTCRTRSSAPTRPSGRRTCRSVRTSRTTSAATEPTGPCPGPGVPNTRDGSAYINTEGEAATFPADHEPPGHAIPPVVPFDVGQPGGGE